MAKHLGQRTNRDDLRPPVKRFGHVDRVEREEADRIAAARAQREAEEAALPPVEPDRVVEVDGKQVKVYVNDNAREMARRTTQARRVQEGGR